MVGQDDVPRLLAADIAAALAHRFQHIAVADLGAVELELLGLPAAARARGWTSPSPPPPSPLAVRRARLCSIAISAISWSPSTTVAGLVDHDQPVGVAVERQADVARRSRPPLRCSACGCGRSAAVVDVGAIGRHPERDDVGAKLPQRLGRDLVSGAVGAIDHDLEPVEPELLGKGRLGEMDVAARARRRSAWRGRPCRPWPASAPCPAAPRSPARPRRSACSRRGRTA